MKTRFFSLFVLVVSLILVSSASGVLAQRLESTGMRNLLAAQQQARNVEVVGQIGGLTVAVLSRATMPTSVRALAWSY